MIQDNITYNPDRDIKPVSPDGWLDLKKAFTDGVVPGNLDFDDDEGNGLDDPATIGESPRDVFQAQRYKSALVNKAKSAKKTAPADTPEGGEQ